MEGPRRRRKRRFRRRGRKRSSKRARASSRSAARGSAPKAGPRRRWKPSSARSESSKYGSSRSRSTWGKSEPSKARCTRPKGYYRPEVDCIMFTRSQSVLHRLPPGHRESDRFLFTVRNRRGHSRNRTTPARARSSRYSVTNSIETGSSSADTASRISATERLPSVKFSTSNCASSSREMDGSVRTESRGEMVVIIEVGRPLDALAPHGHSIACRRGFGLEARRPKRRDPRSRQRASYVVRRATGIPRSWMARGSGSRPRDRPRRR